ncbi:MAG: ATP-binding cassette domain-containing protein [Christensenella sp.]|nr:ATP-binding cassette domain-containing protein [Christensenella sp.]
MLELNHIDLRFNANSPDELNLFSDFSFAVPEGQFVSIIGSNGSGKSTLLNLICGTARPDAGNVLFDGRNITTDSAVKRAAWIGRVFQDPKAGTCAHLTILENLALADHKGGVYGLGSGIPKHRKEHFRALLSLCGMGLENRLDAPVGTLSGGQRQALALVIATMSDIRLLILDEHTAALDPKSSETIMTLTNDLIGKRGITTVMVTHNLRYAATYGDRLVMLHQGGVVLDKAGEDKGALAVDDLLKVFTDISIEMGN